MFIAGSYSEEVTILGVQSASQLQRGLVFICDEALSGALLLGQEHAWAVARVRRSAAFAWTSGMSFATASCDHDVLLLPLFPLTPPASRRSSSTPSSIRPPSSHAPTSRIGELINIGDADDGRPICRISDSSPKLGNGFLLIRQIAWLAVCLAFSPPHTHPPHRASKCTSDPFNMPPPPPPPSSLQPHASI